MQPLENTALKMLHSWSYKVCHLDYGAFGTCKENSEYWYSTIGEYRTCRQQHYSKQYDTHL